jgi:trans-aconitate methyltransferase
VLDAGCGAGYTTAALARLFPSARVTGVDISHDAVAYARATHPSAEFRAEAISPSSPPEGTFDAIFCFEFYPFTRNADAIEQAGYLRAFASRLAPGGCIVVYQTWRNPNSLGAVYREVRAALPELSFRKRLTAHPRLKARLPIALAWASSWVGTVLARRDWLKPIVVVTRRDG